MEDKKVSEESAKESTRKTVFARNLPYSTTDKELEDIFSEYGPIKRCFVVKDKDKGSTCRGFGYVSFVMQEDAAKSLASKILMGTRKLQLSIADKKPRQRDNYQPKKKPSEGEEEEITDDKVETSADDATPKEKTKKKQIAKENTVQTDGKQKENLNLQPKPVFNREIIDQEKRTIVISNLDSKTTKSKLKLFCSKQGKVEKIEYPAPGRSKNVAFVTFKSIKSTVRAFQKLNGTKFGDSVIHSYLLSKEGKQPANQLLDKKCQLIVRNLSFKCSEKDLSSVFEKCGTIAKLELPMKLKSTGGQKFLGFAFVHYSCQEDAKNALDQLNKTLVLGRPMVIDWAIPKDQYVKETGTKEQESTKDSEQGDEGKKVKKGKEGKKSKTEQKSDDEMDADDDEDDEIEEEESDDEGGSDEGGSDEEGSDEGGSDEEGSDENSDEEDDSDSLQKELEKKERLKKQSKDAKEGKTVFIRNLPFEIMEEEVVEYFSKYGDVEYCKLVIDQETGHSRGSAFIKYKEIDAADLAVAQAEDGASVNEILLGGRRLTVVKAVTKGKVKEIEKKKKDSKKDPKDKRNMALMHEGVIFPNSEAAEGLSEGDLKKREKAFAEKKTKMKNQNYFISKTRLSVRNLPLTIGERELKETFLKAVNRPGVKIIKTLLMRNKERLDQTGKARSLGFGFIELDSHENALAILRATNNNADLFGENRRPIVEFSVENQLALNIQKKRLEKQQHKLQQGSEATGQDAEGRQGVKRKHEGSDRSGKKKKDEEGKQGRSENDAPDVTEAVSKRSKKPKASNQKAEQQTSIENPNDNKANDQQKKSPARIDTLSANKNARKSAGPKSGNVNAKKTLDSKDSESQSEPKMKKPKKKQVIDHDEKQFNVLVNNYKEKLFGVVAAPKKISEKRWFE